MYTLGGCGSFCDAQPSTYRCVNWALFPVAVKSTFPSETRGCSEKYSLLRSPFVIASPDLSGRSNPMTGMGLVGQGFITCQKEAACRVPLYKGGEI